MLEWLINLDDEDFTNKKNIKSSGPLYNHWLDKSDTLGSDILVINKKTKAQPFDCMQYFYGAVLEPRIRCFIQFQDHISETALNRAVNLSMGIIPLIGCIFDEKLHCWKERSFTADDIIHLIKVPAGNESPSLGFLLSAIDHTREPQLKIFIVREVRHDTLCIIINHMISDGAGFKEYLYLLCDLYSMCEKDAGYNSKPEALGKRNLNQVLQNLSCKEKLGILISKSGSNKPDSSMIMPLKGDSANPIIVITHIEKDKFNAIRNMAKTNHASMNDVILTAYIRALRWITGCKEITVPCPVDLRKYKKADHRCGICNLTGNYICRVETSSSQSFYDTFRKVSAQMHAQKGSNVCLKGPMLYNMMFHTLPFHTVQKLFNRISPVPVTAYTNLGVLDDAKFNFGNHVADDAFISTAVRKAPYFQLSVSTYQERCTLTSSLYGSEEDRQVISSFFEQMINELFLLTSYEN